MENTSYIQFDSIYQKMMTEEHSKNVISLYSDSLKYEIELNDKYQYKFNDCMTLLEKIKNISKEEKLDTSLDGKILVNSIPIPNKEKEFKKTVEAFNSCYSKFLNLDNIYQRRISYLFNFPDLSLDNCIKNNCRNLISQEKSEIHTRSCIKDCFKNDIYNRSVMNILIKDEFIKYLKEIEKI